MSELLSQIDLTQLKRSAKNLKKAFDSGDVKAQQRVLSLLPSWQGEKDLKLASAQFIIAREYGYKNWIRLKEAIKQKSRSLANKADALLHFVLDGEYDQARQLLADDPALAQENFFTAVVTAQVHEVEDALARDREQARNNGGVGGCEPIVLVCCANLYPDNTGFNQRREKVLTLLLSHGADPNAEVVRSAEHLSALLGTVRSPGTVKLTAILLDAGAAPRDAKCLIHACEQHDRGCLLQLLQHNPRQPHLSAALQHLLESEDLDGTRLLLEHGADANQVHWAIYNRRSLACIQLLVQFGADIQQPYAASLHVLKGCAQTTPVQWSERLGQRLVTDYLLQHIADTRTPLDRFIGAARNGDRQVLAGIIEQYPDLVGKISWTDQGALASVAREGNFEAVKILLEYGFALEARADDLDATALLYACAYGREELAKFLLEKGADYYARTNRDEDALCTTISFACLHRESSSAYAKIAHYLLVAGVHVDDETINYALSHQLDGILAVFRDHGYFY